MATPALLPFSSKPLAQKLTLKTFMIKNIIYNCILISGHSIARQAVKSDT
jgi:hypothetical protein